MLVTFRERGGLCVRWAPWALQDGVFWSWAERAVLRRERVSPFFSQVTSRVIWHLRGHEQRGARTKRVFQEAGGSAGTSVRWSLHPLPNGEPHDKTLQRQTDGFMRLWGWVLGPRGRGWVRLGGHQELALGVQDSWQ